MRWILIIAGVLAGLVAIVVVVGFLLPKGHVATRSATIAQPPTTVWHILTDVSAYPGWRKDVKHVEMVPATAGHLAWREQGTHDAMAYEAEEFVPPRRLISISKRSPPAHRRGARIRDVDRRGSHQGRLVQPSRCALAR
jgi:hypothetical protein